MRIYSLTATFGKLEHETLVLTPGLNVITARNEWGKSTWCAFLIAMFYGIDTRTKSTRTVLADKERYAPWSGSPMSGRIDLNWNGQDITIERSTRGRIPMGQFRAYETGTGLPLPEITAQNCGQLLLGVERSVFLRSGFIRFRDLNVADDEALRRRLNNLVTSGDEDGSADRLAGELRQLRSRIRYNRTGLLPQAEAERDSLENALHEYRQLEAQRDHVHRRLDELEDWRLALENHLDALNYDEAQEGFTRISQAQRSLDGARKRFQELSDICDSLPDPEKAAESLEALRRLEQEQACLRERLQRIPPVDAPSALAEPFRELDAEEALAAAGRDVRIYEKVRSPRYRFLLPGPILTAVGILMGLKYPAQGFVFGLIGAAVLFVTLTVFFFAHRKKLQLETRYGSNDPRHWIRMARDHGHALWLRSPEAQLQRRDRCALEQQVKVLDDHIRAITGGEEADTCRSQWAHVCALRNAREEALREYRGAQESLDTLCSVVRPANPPAFPDRLKHSRDETRKLLAVCSGERQEQNTHLGRIQARMEALGSPEAMGQALVRSNARIESLQQRYDALDIALNTLEDAVQTLQRRFAPRITQQAQALMYRMTEGRYDRVQLNRDLTMEAGAEQENFLHGTLWRSDGTVDQLYLALRLSVARELIPSAPLVLDDALVRFDDNRLKAALDILKEEAQSRQVILFTCQSREKHMLE